MFVKIIIKLKSLQRNDYLTTIILNIATLDSMNGFRILAYINSQLKILNMPLSADIQF